MQILMERISAVYDGELQEKPAYITQERWEKIGKIKFPEDKKRSLLAGKLLAKMCKELGITEPVYETEGKGKTILVGHPDIGFNLSHSGEYVVLVYKRGLTDIGVDIQEIRKMSDGLKRRLLHEKESVADDLAVQEKEKMLNRIWAIKESYVKMTGEGLSHDFRKIRIDFEAGTVMDESGRSACFSEPEAPDGYVLAIVTDSEDR